MTTVIDFGDLLVAVAENLDEIRQCVGCGADSTWAGLFVDDQGVVSVAAWCDAPACEHDRTVLSKGYALACPIDHLPGLRRREARGLDALIPPPSRRKQCGCTDERPCSFHTVSHIDEPEATS